MAESAGIRLTHVPYRGGGPAITDALGGQIDLIFDTAAALNPHVKAGKLRAYAVTGLQPYAPASAVPLIRAELKNDYEAYSWFGLVAPAGTQASIVDRLIEAMSKVSASPEVQRELLATGVEPGVATSKQFAQVIEGDLKKWSEIILRANVKSD
jgi:tripartite-type tricarboxylate transporter receptor subunit TctC